MKTEIDPRDTPRAYAFEMWMKAPMPMVTLFKTLDVTRLRRRSRQGLKFNMLMCWSIGKAASQTEEFLMLPVGDRLFLYDGIAVNTIVATADGRVASCDIPFTPDLATFSADYTRLTRQVSASGHNHDIPDKMVIGTSSLARHYIDGAVGMYSGIYANPFMIWGRYRKRLFKTTLTISLQFHHTQMDGAHAARFLDCLQTEIHNL